jgi:hypothetical protein
MVTKKEAGETSPNAKICIKIIIAIALFVLDALVIESFYVAGTLLMVIIPVKLVKAFKLRGDKRVFKLTVIGVAIYTLTAISIIVMFSVNNTIAIKRAEMIADACERYKTTFGTYPSNLAILAPEFIKEVPSAKIGLVSGGFHYTSTADSHWIMFVNVPPYGRKYYSLETKKWGTLD